MFCLCVAGDGLARNVLLQCNHEELLQLYYEPVEVLHGGEECHSRRHLAPPLGPVSRPDRGGQCHDGHHHLRLHQGLVLSQTLSQQ